MFGNIFEAQNDVGTAEISVANPKPVEQRGPSRFAGLENRGATCYLNSLLQTLLFTPELRESIFKLTQTDLEAEKGHQVRQVPLQLQKLFARMLLLDQSTVSTAELTDSFGWNSNEELYQQDVQELNRTLFSALEDSLVGTDGEEIVNRLYKGVLVNRIICHECNHTSEKDEHFLDLTAAIHGHRDLLQSFDSSFKQVEELCDKNQYHCGHCDRLVNATKSVRLRRLPEILTICLLRISFDYGKLQRAKETSSFKFPLNLSMAPYLDEKVGSLSYSEYELFAVVIHSGGTHAGHYHAYIKDIDELGAWNHPEPSSAPNVQINSKGKSAKQETNLLQCETPLEVLHVLLGKSPNMELTAEQLSQLVEKETGVTWNKQFKKQYGSITKFLAKNPELYAIDQTSKVVTLKQQPATESRLDGKEPDSHSHDRGSGGGAHWFDFDDRRVKAITVTDIEKQFEGRECAYMLYYRRTDLQRPAEAKSNPLYAVPPHLIKEIDITNSQLCLLRMEYESKQHEVAINIYQAAGYRSENNFLISPSQQHLRCEIIVDRRLSVSDIKRSVSLKVELEPSGYDLYIVKPCLHILHIVRKLSDNNECVASLHLQADEGVCLLTSGKVEREHILCGNEHEPLKLTIRHEGCEQTLCFARSMIMEELFRLICLNYAVSESVQLLKTTHKGTKATQFLPSEDTLAQQLTGFDVIEVVSPHQGGVEHVNLTSSTAVLVKINGSLADIRLQDFELHMEQTRTIGELCSELVKSLAPRFNQKVTRQFRLTKSPSCPTYTPLFNDTTLTEAGLADGVSLYIEPGIPLSSNQMLLWYSTDNSGLTFEICVNSSLTVRQCLNCMTSKANMDKDSDFQMRKISWMGEMGEPICDMDSTLMETGLLHGDNIRILHGAAPSKDDLIISVLLDTDGCDNRAYREWVMSSLKDLSLSACCDKLDRIDALTDSRFLALGDIHASFDSSLEQLKVQIWSMELCPQVHSIEHLRLRALDGNRKAAIYRGHQKTLRSLKLRNKAQVLVQVIPHPENLSDHDILLELRCRLNADYGAAEWLLWDTTTGRSETHLKQRIASYLRLDGSQLALAKYFPERHEWVVIPPGGSYKTNSKAGKRGQPQAPSLLKGPVHLQDGDLIGYMLSPNPRNVLSSEFDTEADHQARLLSTQIKMEEMKQRAQECDVIKTNDATYYENEKPYVKPREEKGISISIPKFGSQK